MIFITAGTTQFPFKRLDDIVIKIHKIFPNQKIIYQSMNVQKILFPKDIEIRNFIPQKEFVNLLKNADLNISQAGYATVMQLIEFSKLKPFIIPRLKKYHEHVNDHQKFFADYIKNKGLIRIIDEDFNPEDIRKDKPQSRVRVAEFLKDLEIRKNLLIDYLSQVTESPLNEII